MITQEFTREGVEMTKAAGVTARQVAREPGINPNVLNRRGLFGGKIPPRQGDTKTGERPYLVVGVGLDRGVLALRRARPLLVEWNAELSRFALRLRITTCATSEAVLKNGRPPTPTRRAVGIEADSTARRGARPMEVTRLGDQFADYLLSAGCRRCKHTRSIDPYSLAQSVGWNGVLSRLASRLRCSKCSARNCENVALRRSKTRR